MENLIEELDGAFIHLEEEPQKTVKKIKKNVNKHQERKRNFLMIKTQNADVEFESRHSKVDSTSQIKKIQAPSHSTPPGPRWPSAPQSQIRHRLHQQRQCPDRCKGPRGARGRQSMPTRE